MIEKGGDGHFWPRNLLDVSPVQRILPIVHRGFQQNRQATTRINPSCLNEYGKRRVERLAPYVRHD
jgi:hypothetical protein